MRAVLLARVALLSLLVAGGAAGSEYADEPFETPEPERRYGFSMGISGGLAVGAVRGFPDDASKIGVKEFEASTGLGVSSGGALWLGGSLTDWLSLGIGVLGGSTSGNGLSGSGGSIQVRVETFPLLYRGGAFRDLGLLLTFGTGGYTLERDGEKAAVGEATSSVGGGVFYEPLQLWQLSMGPQLEYAYQFSDALTAHLLVLGWRTTFYGGP